MLTANSFLLWDLPALWKSNDLLGLLYKADDGTLAFDIIELEKQEKFHLMHSILQFIEDVGEDRLGTNANPNQMESIRDGIVFTACRLRLAPTRYCARE